MQTLNNRWRRSPSLCIIMDSPTLDGAGVTTTGRNLRTPRHAHMPGSTQTHILMVVPTYVHIHKPSSQTAGTSPFGVVKHTLRKGWKQPSYTQDGTLSPVADVAEDAAGVARELPSVHLPVLLPIAIPRPCGSRELLYSDSPNTLCSSFIHVFRLFRDTPPIPSHF